MAGTGRNRVPFLDTLGPACLAPPTGDADHAPPCRDPRDVPHRRRGEEGRVRRLALVRGGRRRQHPAAGRPGLVGTLGRRRPRGPPGLRGAARAAPVRAGEVGAGIAGGPLLADVRVPGGGRGRGRVAGPEPARRRREAWPSALAPARRIRPWGEPLLQMVSRGGLRSPSLWMAPNCLKRLPL